VKFLACVFFSLVLAGCATSYAQDHSAELPLPKDYFDSQAECGNVWDEIIEGWVVGGGKVLGTIKDTRRSILTNNNSTLSNIFVSVWALQNNDQNKRRKSKRELALMFENVATNEIPAECRSIIWIQDEFAHAEGVISQSNRESLLNSAPDSARIDERSFSRWLVYELLGTKGGGG
jgi:hypothetical protein